MVGTSWVLGGRAGPCPSRPLPSALPGGPALFLWILFRLRGAGSQHSRQINSPRRAPRQHLNKQPARDCESPAPPFPLPPNWPGLRCPCPPAWPGSCRHTAWPGTWHGVGAASRRAQPSLRLEEPPSAGPVGAEPPPSEAEWLSPLEICTGMVGEELEWARGRDGTAGLVRSRCPQGTPVCPCPPPPVPSWPRTPPGWGRGCCPQALLRAPSPMPNLAEQVWDHGVAFGWRGCPVGPQCPQTVPTASPRPPHSAKLGLVSCACRCRRPSVVNRGDRR